MGIYLSSDGGLTQSQKEKCTRTGKDPEELLRELKKLSINKNRGPNAKPTTTKEKKIVELKKVISKSEKPDKPKKFSWKTRTAK